MRPRTSCTGTRVAMSSPSGLQTAEGRREFFRKAREKLRGEQTADRERAGEGLPEPGVRV